MIRDAWRGPALALRFLSRLPIPGDDPARFARDLPAALAAFPLAGALLGGLSGLVLLLAAAAFPLPLAAMLALAFDAWLTRALHEDAVADLADGLGGGRDAEAAHAIMKDSRIGAFGALALVLAVGLRWAVLAAMDGPAAAALALVLSGAAARAAMLGAMAILPARPGTGATFAAALDRRVLRRSLLLSLPVVAPFAWWSAPALLAAAAATAAMLAWLRRVVRRRLGGATGDVFGAAGFGGGLLALLALAAR